MNAANRRAAAQLLSTASTIDRAAAHLAKNRPDAAFALIAHHEAEEGPSLALRRLAARALLAMRLRDHAIGCLFSALEMQSDDAESMGLLGDALFQDGKPTAALRYSQAAFDCQPTADHATTLSCILIELGRHLDALAVTKRGLRHRSNVAALWLNRSIALESLGLMPAATGAARKAMSLAPGNAFVRHHLATTLLVQGRTTTEAWTLYENRLGAANIDLSPIHHRRWQGEDVAGKTVLLHAEQGLGDTIQFVRYIPRVVALGARVILAVQPGLVRLLQPCISADQIVAVGGVLPHFDLYAPLLSLPGLFGTTLDTIPPLLPYSISRSPLGCGPMQVGLAWAGNPGFVADGSRSIRPDMLGSLADIPGVAFHSLQFGTAEAPPGIRFASDLRDAADFADTAARIAGLDLVISVDTAVAHLAGTMSVPVWLLSRFRGCWRWLQDRNDSPWYPGLRVMRQPGPGDWASVIATIQADLPALARQHRTHATAQPRAMA